MTGAEGLSQDGFNALRAALGPAVLSGVQDSLSPFVLALVLLFFLLINIFCRNRASVYWLGLNFIGGILFAKLLLVVGVGVEYLSQPVLWMQIIWFNRMLAVMCIIYGFMQARDWWHLTQTKNAEKLWICSPFYARLRDDQEHYAYLLQPVDWGRLLLLGLLWGAIGFVLGLFGIFISEDYRFFFHLGYLVSQGNNLFLIFAMLGYVITYVGLLFFCWMVLMGLSRMSNIERGWSLRNLRFFKILNAACFIASGLGFLFFLR